MGAPGLGVKVVGERSLTMRSPLTSVTEGGVGPKFL